MTTNSGKQKRSIAKLRFFGISLVSQALSQSFHFRGMCGGGERGEREGGGKEGRKIQRALIQHPLNPPARSSKVEIRRQMWLDCYGFPGVVGHPLILR